MLNNSSIESHALFKVLRLFAPDSDAKIISYCVNFDALWDLYALELGASNIILVWDRPRFNLNLGSINIADFLTPLTWSICAMQRFHNLRIAILDLCPQEHSSDGTFQFYSSLLPEKRPFILLNLENFIPGLIRFADDTSRPKRNIDTLEILKNYLKVLLTERSEENDPHAIANLIGPLALLGDRLQPTSKLYSKPLLSLFRWLGLFIPKNDLLGNPIIRSDAQPSKREGENASRDSSPSIETKNKIRALLIDDQEMHGWSEWTESMLRDYPGIRLESVETPDVLINTLNEAKGLMSKNKDCRFHLDIPIVHKDESEWGPEPFETILLLDLRLFSQETIKKEADWVKSQLIPLCRLICRSSPGDDSSAKAGFSSTELDAVESWCAKPVKNSEEHLIALTLLPRLISLFDYSLPIIIFSNTSQRRIVELFKPFKNIITDFSKPRFTGLESSDLVEETESGFRKALNKAINWVEARTLCRRIIRSAKASRAPQNSNSETYRYIELFLDESDWRADRDYFSLGGCYAVFDGDTAEKAFLKAEFLDEELKKGGLRHFHNRGIGSGPNWPILEKKDDLRSYLTPLASEYKPSKLGCLRLRIKKDTKTSKTGPLNIFDIADNRFHRAMESLIELFLFVTIPALFANSQVNSSNDKTSISIFPATRVVPFNELDKAQATFQFGFKQIPYKNLFFSFDRADVYRIVARILDFYNKYLNFCRLVAIQLPYEKDPDKTERESYKRYPEYYYCPTCKTSVFISAKEKDFRISCECRISSLRPDYHALHYLADELLNHFPTSGKPNKYADIFAGRLVEGEFDDKLNEDLESLINSCRCLDRGDIVGSLNYLPLKASLPEKNYTSPRSDKPPVLFWFLQQLSTRLGDFSADDFSRLVSSRSGIKGRMHD